jgi:hypothetical protein
MNAYKEFRSRETDGGLSVVNIEFTSAIGFGCYLRVPGVDPAASEDQIRNICSAAIDNYNSQEAAEIATRQSALNDNNETSA